MRRTPLMLLALFAGSAHAQQPPPRLWTKIQTTTAHATVAAHACAMEFKAFVDGAYRPIAIQAFEDNAVICGSTLQPDSVRASIVMTNDITRSPSDIVIEIAVPPNASPQALNDLRNVLLSTSNELQKRLTQPAAPVIVQQPVAPPPPVPMHAETAANWGLIGAGIGMMGAGYLFSALVGGTVASSRTDPGTPTWWPFVPFVGSVVFSATYREAPDCNCAAGRFFSVLGSVVIDGLQVAGLVLTIVGIATPKTVMVPDSISLRFGPGSAFIVGTF